MQTRSIKGIRPSDLKPGDILLFRSSPTPFTCQKMIMFFQGLLSLSHGHSDTTHAAVCVDNDEKKGPIIAHSYEMGDQCGYIRQPLSEMQAAEENSLEGNGDRPFLVFRPKDQYAAKVVAEVAGNQKKNRHIKWTTKQAIKTYFRCAFWSLSEERAMSKTVKTMPKEAICSQFVIRSIKVAEHKRYTEGETIINRLTIRSSSTPKALEACLYKDVNNYDFMVYPGAKPFESLIKAIKTELKAIKARHYTSNEYSQLKRRKVRQHYKALLKKYKYAEFQSELDSCLELLSIVMPILNQHAGFGWFGLCNTTSYNSIRDEARKLGIFERDIQQYSEMKTSRGDIELVTKKY